MLLLKVVDIKGILLISSLQDAPRFNELLRDGFQYGLSIQYAV
jgi:dTDP-glucose pyrophosphorylase